MLTQSLTGLWQFRQAGDSDWLPAQAPGCAHTDLLAAGRIPDPFVEANEKQVQWVAERDWEYQRVFTAGPELLAQEHVELVCDGLDTLAELTLNGRKLGHTDNMFRQYRWDVKHLLQAGANTLTIIIRSPTAYIAARQKAYPIPSLTNPGMAHLRKAPSHFGWDWGPRLPASGIWRDIRLEGSSAARLTGVTVRQEHAAGQVTLSVSVTLERWNEGEPAGDLMLDVTLIAPDGATTSAGVPVLGEGATLKLLVAHPQLWWPNGLGEHPLYRVEVILQCGELPLDQRFFQVGLRTVELQHSPDEWGQSFTIVVNGFPIFAKGANWIPADSFPARVTAEQMEYLIQSAAAANMNMLRVWGGGYYEDDRFYDLCDRYGILVWQDFIFACSPYPLDDLTFVENIHHEVTDNVRRLRNHACLALWCGNNEIESLWRVFRMLGKARTEALRDAHENFFYHLLPGWVQAEDPDHAYVAGSPGSGEFLKPGLDSRGDSHQWQVWHGLKPFTAYRESLTRFASEFGMEALPTLETIEGFARPADRRLNSKVLLHHQRSAGGNGKMLYYLTSRMRLPRNFPDLVYLTQVMQAEAVRIGVEHWRRNSPRCSGTLYWQLNDCWPAASWAGIDYPGRWKALHYAARRFYAPVALSVEASASRMSAYVVNDTQAPWQGQVRWTLETLKGKVISSGEEGVQAPPRSTARAGSIDFEDALLAQGAANLVYVAELWHNRERLSRQVALFVTEKEIDWPIPGLKAEAQAQGDTLLINIKARALARFVMLSLLGEDVIFSDNFFDLPAGCEITVACPMPKGWSADQAQQALHMKSLADVRPAGPAFLDRVRHYTALLNPTSLSAWAALEVFKLH